MDTLKAWDWFNITGRGLVVSVEIEQARNSCAGFNVRKPGEHVICEVRSTT